MKKSCNVCDKNKKLEKFVKLSSSEDGHAKICKKCHRNRQLKYRQNNPDNYKSAKLKHKYGITLEELNQMKEEQEHKCKICKKNKGSELVVDHHHASNTVRALICGHCNKILGFCKENTDILHNSIKYLIEHDTIILNSFNKKEDNGKNERHSG